MWERGPVGCDLRQVFDVYAATVCLTRSVLCPTWHGLVPNPAGSGIFQTPFMLFP